MKALYKTQRKINADRPAKKILGRLRTDSGGLTIYPQYNL